jgi:chromosomal replication initiation ATPase DnaA
MTQQYTLPLPAQEHLGAEDFMVADSNQQAWHWIVKTAPVQWPTHCLMLLGPEGCGKSHLLHIWQTAQHGQPLIPGADILGTLQPGQACLLDDADRLAGQPQLEVWMQHLFNDAREAGAFLLLASRLPPKDWGLQLADIRSRLNSVQTVMVNEPDDDLLTALLMKLFADRQLRVDDQAIGYIVRHFPRSAGLIRALVAFIDGQALVEKRDITINFIKSCATTFMQRATF